MADPKVPSAEEYVERLIGGEVGDSDWLIERTKERDAAIVEKACRAVEATTLVRWRAAKIATDAIRAAFKVSE